MNKYLKPINYLNKIISLKDKFIYQPRYNIESIKSQELVKFSQYQFDYDLALKTVNTILQNNNQADFYSQINMASVHWLLFAGIAQIGGVKSILEIGTFDGQTTNLLSQIFPDSGIVTIDLPDDDPILKSTYNRDNNKYFTTFIKTQEKNTARANITFIKKNSFFLPDTIKQKFDLIWVDGGHCYPEIAWDICNTYHMVNEGGWIMYDDIIPNVKYKPTGADASAYTILKYITDRTSDEITYFLKRLDPYFSANPHKRKYVALLRK